MVQWETPLTTKPNDLSPIPGTYVKMAGNSVKLSSDLHVHAVACVGMCARAHTNTPLIFTSIIQITEIFTHGNGEV